MSPCLLIRSPDRAFRLRPLEIPRATRPFTDLHTARVTELKRTGLRIAIHSAVIAESGGHQAAPTFQGSSGALDAGLDVGCEPVPVPLTRRSGRLPCQGNRQQGAGSVPRYGNRCEGTGMPPSRTFQPVAASETAIASGCIIGTGRSPLPLSFRSCVPFRGTASSSGSTGGVDGATASMAD
jgi:hypothetical protein